MNKDDSLDLAKSVENRNQRVKRSASLIMASNFAVDDYVLQGEVQNEGGDLGNQAPKRRHKSGAPSPLIATDTGGDKMPKSKTSPFHYEAESVFDAEINKSLEGNFKNPAPKAPMRRLNSKSLLQFDNDLTIKGEFMDLESSEIEKYFGDNEQEKSSPSSSPASSPKASSSRIETAKKNITDKLK